MADERRDDRPGWTGRNNQGQPRGGGPGGTGGQGPSGPGGNGQGRGEQGRRPDSGRRFGRHRQFRNRPDPAAEPRHQDQRPEGRRELATCPLCSKPVYDLSTAVSASKESNEPAHFDCVLERVAAAETLAPGEKLVYLGSGAFGVVEFKDRSESAFTVKRRIQWEKEGEKKEWRRNLSSRIANL